MMLKMKCLLVGRDCFREYVERPTAVKRCSMCLMTGKVNFYQLYIKINRKKHSSWVKCFVSEMHHIHEVLTKQLKYFCFFDEAFKISL